MSRIARFVLLLIVTISMSLFAGAQPPHKSPPPIPAPQTFCNPASSPAVDSCTDDSHATAVSGRSATSDGIGVAGRGKTGVSGVSTSSSGAAGEFTNNADGDILRGVGGNRSVFRVGQGGTIFLREPAGVDFGANPRQMLNLYGAAYGIGVQDFGLYQRTDSDFYWYRGGSHDTRQGQPGEGGVLLMHLDSGGDLSVGTTISLSNAAYGIGMQDGDFYQRTDNEFFWYIGGTHSDTFGDPGQNGRQLMRLGNSGDLLITRSVVTPVLQITGGIDVAEPFEISDHDAPKGTVVIIDEENPGHLKLSESPYDKRVAGIVSGANGINPGISLTQHGTAEGQNVALSGRAYVMADASQGAIKPGDLLTTSNTPGYAMRVTDYARAHGAVLGKAMSPLKEGKGMVLVLVTLQ